MVRQRAGVLIKDSVVSLLEETRHSWSTTQHCFSSASTSTTSSSSSVWKHVRSRMRDYKQLSKARLSGLVVATAAAGYVAASTESVNWRGFGWTCLGTMLASSSANALNQVYEVVNDSRMSRTAIRPLPMGRMSRGHALAFAVITGVSGVYILNKKVNTTAAVLGGGNIALYAGVYTPLKQISIVNTWIGAIVGAIPPLMGWAGAHGQLDSGAFLLAAGLYFWQMPHFMSLAWLCRKDYAAGGYKMLSLVDPTGKRTAACALRNCMYLYAADTANFYAKPSNTNARILFRASLLHLPIFMISFLLHRIPNTGEDRMTLLMEHARLLGMFQGDDRVERHAIQHPSLPPALVPGVSDIRRRVDFIQPPLPFLPVPTSAYASTQAPHGQEEASDS
eukprot:jgi/Picre1/28457/NNA_003861.t1